MKIHFYLLIYNLFENDHFISYHETRRKSDVVPLFTQAPEGELFQCGLCKACDDELVESGLIIQPWRFTFMLKHVKQSSGPKAIFDKLLWNPFLCKCFKCPGQIASWHLVFWIPPSVYTVQGRERKALLCSQACLASGLRLLRAVNAVQLQCPFRLGQCPSAFCAGS